MSNQKLKVKTKNPDFAEGTTKGWNERSNTGWKIEGNEWIQYKKGAKTGATRNIKDQGDFYHDESTGRDMRWHPAYGKYMPSYGASPAQAITRPIRNRLKAIKKGWDENPGVGGIFDPRVWQGMGQLRKNLQEQRKFEDTYKTLEEKKQIIKNNKEKTKKSNLWIDKHGDEWNLETLNKGYSKYKYVPDPKNKERLLVELRPGYKPDPVITPPKKPGWFEPGGYWMDKKGDINPGGPGNRLGDSFSEPLGGN